MLAVVAQHAVLHVIERKHVPGDVVLGKLAKKKRKEMGKCGKGPSKLTAYRVQNCGISNMVEACKGEEHISSEAMPNT